MTLPEHLICSVMLGQLGCRQKFGWKGVGVMAVAGVSPDADVVTKLISEPLFWRLHHALGHSLISIVVLSLIVSGIGAGLLRLPFRPLFCWSLLAAFVHDLTDLCYWWGIHLFWPMYEWAPMLRAIEYLDLFVLGMWLGSAVLLYRFPNQGRVIGISSLSLFFGYVVVRMLLPQPTGWLHAITGGWMYMAPNETPILDWW